MKKPLFSRLFASILVFSALSLNSSAGYPRSWEMREVKMAATQLRLAAERLQQGMQRSIRSPKEAMQVNADFGALYRAASKMESYTRLYELRPEMSEPAYLELQRTLSDVENKWSRGINYFNATRNAYWSMTRANSDLGYFYAQ